MKTALIYMENTKARKREICAKITGVKDGSKTGKSDGNLTPAKPLTATASSEETPLMSAPGSPARNTSSQSTHSSPSTDQPSEMRIITSDGGNTTKNGNESGTNVYHINLAGASNVNLTFR